MALLKCPECGKAISDKAQACPSCGHPIRMKCPKCNLEQPFAETCQSCGIIIKKYKQRPPISPAPPSTVDITSSDPKVKTSSEESQGPGKSKRTASSDKPFTKQKASLNVIYLILYWFFGGLFLVLGVTSLLDTPLASIALFLIAALLLPPVRKFAFEKTNKSLSTRVRFYSVMILFLTFGILAAGSQEEKAHRLAQQQAKEQAEEKAALNKKKIAHFTTNKSSIMEEIQSEYDDGNYQQVLTKAQNHLISKDPELLNLHKQAKDKLADIRKKEQTEQILAKLQSVPKSNLEKNTKLYQQLVSLNPDNEDYKIKHNSFSKKLAKAKEKLRLAAERKNLIKSQFSSWDGSHRGLEKFIKSSMNDPSSYEHVETSYSDQSSHLIVLTVFRGKNGFGALVKNSMKAKVDLNGNVLQIIK